MIRKTIKDFCDTPELIENYAEAVASLKRWDCHHRRELEFTREELKARGEYYHRPPEELIFLPRSEHNRLHYTVCKGWEEHVKKISEKTSKNNAKYWKGKKFSAETKEKISKALKGKNTWSKGRHLYNNGVTTVRAFECPEGFVPGRLKSQLKTNSPQQS